MVCIVDKSIFLFVSRKFGLLVSSRPYIFQVPYYFGFLLNTVSSGTLSSKVVDWHCVKVWVVLMGLQEKQVSCWHLQTSILALLMSTLRPSLCPLLCTALAHGILEVWREIRSLFVGASHATHYVAWKSSGFLKEKAPFLLCEEGLLTTKKWQWSLQV